MFHFNSIKISIIQYVCEKSSNLACYNLRVSFQVYLFIVWGVGGGGGWGVEAFNTLYRFCDGDLVMRWSPKWDFVHFSETFLHSYIQEWPPVNHKKISERATCEFSINLNLAPLLI